MEFVTTDGKITFDGQYIRQERLTNTHRKLLYLNVFLFLFLFKFLTEKLDIALSTGKTIKWVIAGVYSIMMFPYLTIAFDYLFKRTWQSKIDIKDISNIESAQSEEGLETVVTLKLKSKRYQTYHFRTLEKQAEGFIEAIKPTN